jgi:hypothetical protein
MKIFLSCLQSPVRHAVPAYGFWENYFKEGILEAGYSWIEDSESDWAEGLLYFHHEEAARIWREKFWSGFTKRFIRQVDQEKPDLAIFYLYPHMIDPEGLAKIRKTGVPTLLFFCDNVREFQQIPSSFRGFDFYWVPEKAALDAYHSGNFEGVMYLPMPVWIPPQFRVQSEFQDQYPPTFIGSRDVQRLILLHEITKLYPELEIRGPGWSHIALPTPSASKPRGVAVPGFWTHNRKFVQEHGVKAWFRKITRRFVSLKNYDLSHARFNEAVFGDDYFRVTREAAVTLGVNRYPSFRFPLFKPDTYSRLRDIEAPMAGACYLTEWAPGIEDLYELGVEIEIYKTPEEAAHLLQELMANPERRKKLRVNGQRKALEVHSIPRSLQHIRQML